MAKRTCSIDGCERAAGSNGGARGWCGMHYNRWRRHGDPLRVYLPWGTGREPVARTSSKTVVRRSRSREFLNSLDDRDPHECWEWPLTRKRGYGYMNAGGRTVQAHRHVYELRVGPIPDGLVIDHLCRNPPCVNPDHLEPVTVAENNRRAAPAMKTHCLRGHLYDEANTRLIAGRRNCRICIMLRARGYRRQRSEARRSVE